MAIRCGRWGSLLLLVALFVALFGPLAAPAGHAAPAQEPAPQVLDEVIVTGERSGPGLWHVHRGDAHLWILGTVTPLPKDMTWRSAGIDSLLGTTNQVLVVKAFEIGLVRALWLLVTQRELLTVSGGRRLKDVLPADLYARFAAQRARYGEDPDKWERYRPIIAVAFLQQTALRRAGLSAHLDVGGEVRWLARKHGVAIDEVKIAGARDFLEALRTMSPGVENACVAAGLATVETGLPRLQQRARAWATGDIERIQQLPEPPEVNACRDAIAADTGAGDLLALIRRTMLEAMLTHLRTGGTTLAVVNMDLLLEPQGLLDRLRDRGYQVDAP